MSAVEESPAFFHELSSYKKRLETFVNWPYTGRNKCTAERLAESGFFHPANSSSDVAQCFVCFKELEGWEPNDDPKTEHKQHSPDCPFLKSKPYEHMSAFEGLEMDIIRHTNLLRTLRDRVFNEIELEVNKQLRTISDLLSKRFRKRGRTRTKCTTAGGANSIRSDVLETSTCSTRSKRTTRSRR